MRIWLTVLVITCCSFIAPPIQAQATDKAKPEVGQTAWSTLNNNHRKILAPLEKDWATLPGSQQQRLIAAARKYPDMRPIQQERFQERITTWARLTPEQRNAARDTYKDLSRLPPEKQHELREKWKARKAEKAAGSEDATSGLNAK
ncbi:MAG: DUF3106 domain-containing protein [Burkholderiales bacterium]|nr:DUF3106 domain-containing protein [Burkholderiales bacterium]